MHDADFAEGVLEVIDSIRRALDHLERAVRQQAALEPEPAHVLRLADGQTAPKPRGAA